MLMFEGAVITSIEGFCVKRIDEEIFARIRGKSYKDDCTLPLDELRYLRLLYKDLEGRTHSGELVCNVHIVHDLLDIFSQLYGEGYPIEKIRLVDEYGSDDEASMSDNNSSCFNFRFISYTNKVSKHGLGLAVDINPLYNPYVKEVDGRLSIEPTSAEPYLDRSLDFHCKIDEHDFCCRLFKEHGFEWGGDWEGRKDYQHFEVSDEVIGMLYPEFA